LQLPATDEEIPGYIWAIKQKLRAAKFSIMFDLNIFSEILDYDVGWLSGADSDVIQKSNLTESIDEAISNFNADFLKHVASEEGADEFPKFALRTKRYTAKKNGNTRTSAPVITVSCEQKNIARVRRFFQALHDQYFYTGFNEFVSTKCNMDQRWDCLNQHIEFLADKLYFYVTGSGLDEAHNCAILDEQVTYEKKKSTLRELLADKGIFSFIQQAKYRGGSKLICQHSALVETKINKKATTISPRTWFIDTLIIDDGNNWTTKQFNVRNKLILGKPTSKTNQQPTKYETKKSGPIPVNIWKVKADERSRAQSKVSEGGESLDSIRSQLTEEQEKNKKLTEDNQKLCNDNDTLKERMEKLTTDNSNQSIQLKAAVDRLSKQEADMRDFKSNQETIQAATDKKMAMMMEKFNCMNNNDEQMKNQTKRFDNETPEELSMPETKHNERSKSQKRSDVLPKPSSLFPPKKTGSPPRVLEAIDETGSVLRHRTPVRPAQTSYATTNGGSNW
jgi:hypothetical protein